MDIRDLAAMLEARLDRIEEKVDGQTSRLGQIDVTLARQAGEIEHHIRRTDALERRVEQVAADVAPVKEHVARLKTVAWFIGWAVGAVATGAGLWKAFF
jgi:tetrahydromethanopterin S-methyltransferase subunit G